MSKKREIIPETAMSLWQEIIDRANLTELRNVNGVVIGLTAERKKTLLIPEPRLLTLLLADETHSKLLPFDREEITTIDYLPWFDYGLRLSEPGWLELDGEKFYAGETITVQLGEDTPKAYLSKDSLPLKLKKAEFVGLSYRVFPVEKVVGIRKHFDTLPEHGFELLRLFQII